MAKKKALRQPSPILAARDAFPVEADGAWSGDDDDAQIRFSLTALGEAVVNERDRRRPKFRGFGPCGRIVA